MCSDFLKISKSYQPAGLAGSFPDSGSKLKRIFLTAKPAAAIGRVLPQATALGRERIGITAFYRFLPYTLPLLVWFCSGLVMVWFGKRCGLFGAPRTTPEQNTSETPAVTMLKNHQNRIYEKVNKCVKSYQIWTNSDFTKSL
ncbi:hypothetical protein [Flavobacterium pallidum]|uniref:Uncharacterized protein n=1 Tax=Flavobacterium pallidum TaxID=2172098 RepID=A0A2S1SIL0_9FLAO|nr:hypothetical protein [Flavobacterium pallidum]AWI26225.1 hypothetical protein HYN49_10110 [Flavobacterium pallidum]